MIIEKAKIEDLEDIAGIYARCTEEMNKRGINQWNENYPNKKIVLNDIENGELYILKCKNEFLGVVAINESDPPFYSNIKWSNREGKHLTIHRLAVNPANQKRGFGTKLMNFVYEFALDNQYSSIRFDANTSNTELIKFYEGLGYTKVDVILLPEINFSASCFEIKVE